MISDVDLNKLHITSGFTVAYRVVEHATAINPNTICICVHIIDMLYVRSLSHMNKEDYCKPIAQSETGIWTCKYTHKQTNSVTSS